MRSGSLVRLELPRRPHPSLILRRAEGRHLANRDALAPCETPFAAPPMPSLTPFPDASRSLRYALLTPASSLALIASLPAAASRRSLSRSPSFFVSPVPSPLANAAPCLALVVVVLLYLLPPRCPCCCLLRSVFSLHSVLAAPLLLLGLSCSRLPAHPWSVLRWCVWVVGSTRDPKPLQTTCSEHERAIHASIRAPIGHAIPHRRGLGT
jgi:hypothetical protein